jgi:hypothetical protein
MKQELTEREALLIELVHHLAYGNQEELGLTLEEVMKFLSARVKDRTSLTVLETLEVDGRKFLDALLKL